MTKNYLYSVTDKALFDALNQSKITNNELRDLFLTRGVLTSKNTDREELAKNFSKYVHDYYDHQRIASALGTTPRREKITSSFISNELDTQTLESAAEKLKEKITEENNLCHIYQKSDGTFVVEVTYEVIDYNKSDFKQVVQKTSTIEIEKAPSGLTIRRPDNDHIKEYEESLLSFIEEESPGTELDRTHINLMNIEKESLRTKFFTSLVKEMSGYKLKDVSDVYVYKPKVEAAFMDHEDDPEEGVHITKVSLKGEGVLISPELDSLYERSFYIWKIRWRVAEDLVDPDYFDFEAQFSDPKNCSGFSFISRGAIRYRGKGVYNKTNSQLSEDEETKFTRLIEQTAKKIVADINETSQGGGGHDSKDKVANDQDSQIS
ncbi:hypothetical protein [Vibrio europaeus]|uniref:hypothetical protein n=1 Tax=Vibrio europaeus TaxID=300876 RepID=UPI0018A6FAB1|nr:hypothetical protein [Vibrio europaeus]MDC5813045.1 hypothetical protein [Vibrio europaeus]QPG36060.1 hypothetical protein IXK98_21815 [Vibrio europaeus]